MSKVDKWKQLIEKVYRESIEFEVYSAFLQTPGAWMILVDIMPSSAVLEMRTGPCGVRLCKLILISQSSRATQKEEISNQGKNDFIFEFKLGNGCYEKWTSKRKRVNSKSRRIGLCMIRDDRLW